MAAIRQSLGPRLELHLEHHLEFNLEFHLEFKKTCQFDPKSTFQVPKCVGKTLLKINLATFEGLVAFVKTLVS